MASFAPRSNSPGASPALAAKSTDAIDLMMADRILATTLHYFGDQREARHHIDRALAQLAALAQQPQIVRVRFDMRVSTHYFQARILWLQGFADQALRVVEHNIEEGNAIGQALSFCSVLGQGACPIAFLAGDLDAAERYGAMLLDHTERHPVRLWQVWARCFNGLVIAKRGDLGAGLRALRGALEQAGEARFLPRFLLLLGELAACLGKAGEVGLGLETVDETLARCEARDERWYLAELLRIKGELVILEGARRRRYRCRRTLPAGARMGWPTAGALLAVANRHKPRAALEEPKSSRGGARVAGLGLRPLRRRFRDSGPARGEKPVRGIGVGRLRQGRGLRLDQRGNHRIRRQNGVGEGGPVDFVRSMHRLGAECCCRVPHQSYVIPEFGGAAGGRLDAGVGNHSC